MGNKYLQRETKEILGGIRVSSGRAQTLVDMNLSDGPVQMVLLLS